MQITLPAGEYYVGDPCYSVSHDAEGSEAWNAILTSSNIFEDCIKGSWNGFDVIASPTAYGDGVFTDQNDEYEFGVDAGLIGVIPAALVEHFCFLRSLPNHLTNQNWMQNVCLQLQSAS